MEITDRTRVLEKLQELEGWAEVIAEALHRDPRLERVVGAQDLKQLREISWSLRDRLHVIATEIELSRSEVACS